MSRLGGRLGKLEATAAARSGAHGPAILIVHPDEWPTEDRDAYDAARESEDRCTRDDVIEQQLGVRPCPATMVLAIRVRSDGPQ